MILLHVLLALSSLSLATINFFLPSGKKMNISYGLAAGTLLSGVALIFINNASVLRTCLTGLAFFGVVTVLNTLADRKLVAQKSE